MAEKREVRAVPNTPGSESMMAGNVAPKMRGMLAPAWYNRMSLASIVAGAVVALASWLVLLLLGYAIAFSASAVNSIGELRSISTGLGVWTIISGAIAFFIGSYIASRFAGALLARDGLLHGFATWAFATIIGLPLTAFLLSGVYAFISNWVNAVLGIPSTANITPTAIQNLANFTALLATFVLIGALANLIGSALGGWLGSRRLSESEAMREISEQERMAA